MAKRKLSALQGSYRAFFLFSLSQYEVDSPAQLSREQQIVFFTTVREDWKWLKTELAAREALAKEKQDAIKQKEDSAGEKEKLEGESQVKGTIVKKEQYSKVKASRPSVPLTSNKPSKSNSSNHVRENVAEQIISQQNPEQTIDLQIKYHPNQFFEQEGLYTYPVVKMPKEGSYLKLPRKGRALGKGYKEQDFYKAIVANIPELDVDIDLHMAIPFYNRPYEPDIVLIDQFLKLYIDIEIDEPYDGYYRFPTHEIEKDDIRDLFFNESGWVVIRFTERQIHTQEKECIAYIKDVLNSIYHYRLDESSNCTSEPQWDYQTAIRWEKEHYREKYLSIAKFGKQKNTSAVIVDVNELETIEENLNRTKKFKTAVLQDNIAFEDETHKYHHPKDATGNAQYISVTTLIERFFPFDMDRFIQGKAKREGLTEEEVLEEFLKIRDEAAEKGTYLHEQIENFLKGENYDESLKELRLFEKFYEEIIVAKGFQFIEAEKRILLDEYNVAGTVDALFKKPNKEEYIIVDWKRSKKLVIDGNPRKFGYGFALSELSALDNSSYYKYALQQNIYKYILEQNYGLSISSLNLIVLHENYENYHRVDLKVMNKEVKVILNSINHKI
jgi:hypothetical protein